MRRDRQLDTLEYQADAILTGSGFDTRHSFALGEVFEPFRLPKYAGRFSGPVPPGARCESCAGPRRRGESICRPCVQAEAIRHFSAVADYWLNLWERLAPDFAPELIEAIERRENELGRPACRWPAEETATFLGVTQ